MNKNIRVQNLVLELTRQCPLKCGHCLRGKAQAVTMPEKTIYSALSKVKSINQLTLSGGEPLLCSEGISSIARYLQSTDLEVKYIYIATSASHISQDALDALEELVAIVGDNLMIDISNDKYHNNDGTVASQLKLWSFQMERKYDLSEPIVNLKYNVGREFATPENLIATGNATGWGGRPVTLAPFCFGIDNTISGQEIYVTALGSVVSSCDLSYDDMNKPEAIVVKDIHNCPDLYQACLDYNAGLH